MPNPNRQDEPWRRPEFWRYPGRHYNQRDLDSGDESGHHPLLMMSSRHANNSNQGSLIPWSPGENLGNHGYNQHNNSRFLHPAPMNHALDEEDVGREQQSRCCCRCRWLFCCWCCRRSTSQQQQVHLERSLSQESRGRQGGGICLKIIYLLMSVATMGGLYYYTSRYSKRCWTMNPGESRHVPTAGFLSSDVSILSRTPAPSHHHRHVSDNETVSLGMAVYAMGHADCPPLTGPPVILDSPPQEIVLLHNAFQYQYYYLNKGSTMNVQVHQSKGSCNIMVLKGNKVLARIRNKEKPGQGVLSDLGLVFSLEQIVVEEFSDHAPIEFSFTSPANDVYVLLYDNAASNEPAAFNVSTHMVLTTYDLEGLAPWCSHSAPVDPSSSSLSSLETFFTCPPLPAAQAGCIIVEATESRTNNGTMDRVFLVGEGGVEVTLETTRQWWYIGGLSLIPSLLLALTCCYRSRKRRRSRRRHYHHRDYQAHYEQQVSRGRCEQPRDGGPNYQYLPPHQQEGSDREHEGGIHAADEESSRNRHNRNLSNLSAIFASMTMARRPSAADVENLDNGGQDASMIDIPAENVLVVKEGEQQQQT